jgi:FMN phosphatase YigB (HAD superfamily)
MRVGVDFDNTLVCYDGAFYRAALERELIPAHTQPTKQAVRDLIRAQNREEDWTRLQGFIYGEGMQWATPYPGALAFIERCLQTAVDVCIISHKTRAPYLGASSDLHASAYGWLERHGVFDRVGLPRSRVFFELTKDEKLARIAQQQRTVFVDDLPELLGDPAFPRGVRALLFDPAGNAAKADGFERIGSWDHASRILLGEQPA